LIRKGIERLVPDAKRLPDWAWPIVHRVEERKADGTTVQAYMNDAGKLVVRARVKADDDKPRGLFGLFTAYVPDAKRDQGADVVDVRLEVEDPTTATPQKPAEVEVTATNPKTDETVTTSAKVKRPEEADEVARDAVKDAVDEATDEHKEKAA
jgi:hypothetical protein